MLHVKKAYFLFIVLSVFIVILCCSCSNRQVEETIVNSEGEMMLTKELTEKQSNSLLKSSEYLPIGTVVTVGDGDKKLMIIGLLQVKAEDNQTYDYSAVLYPEGYLDPSETYLFNKNQISRIYYLGYVSQEQKQNNQKIEQLVPSAKNGENKNG